MLVRMTRTATTTERPRAKRANGRRDKALGPVLVSANRLAVHFGVNRSYLLDTLVRQGVIERNAQGLFDQDVSRLRYFAHLRSERARSPRSTADAEHTAAKTEMLRLKLAVQRRELVRQSDVDDLINEIAGITLTALSSMPSCAPVGDLATRRKLQACVFQCRKDLAAIATAKADAAGEPPLEDQ
jgi:hypothetical protein